MSTPDPTPEHGPRGGEFVNQALLLESRFPQIVMPGNDMWPSLLHVETIKAAAIETLPRLVSALSEPVAPATQNQLHSLFANNPHDRLAPWTCVRMDEEGITYSSPVHRGVQGDQGGTAFYPEINHTFDSNGRLTKREFIEDEFLREPQFREVLTYDDEGFVVERTTSGYAASVVTDRFEYTVGKNGQKTPAKMIRTKGTGGSSSPMVVDLANYEEWIETNPDGFALLTREQLQPKELEIADFNVAEYRKGILFAHPEQLEHALVMYGEGRYPTPGGETALEHNVRVYSESVGELGSQLLSLVAGSGDMREFVQSGIMGRVQRAWEQIQKSEKSKAEDNVHFGFDYDGAGHFHKTHGDVAISQNGLELTISAAYVGDKVEDRLASALRTKRGLRSAAIDVPINQTEREGYFFVDVKAVCDKLGIPVTDEEVTDYLREYLFENDPVPMSKGDKRSRSEPAFWQDEATGVRIELVTQRDDFVTRADLDDFFGHDDSALWGPLPKTKGGQAPQLRISVKPQGDPFAKETTEQTDATIRSYMARLDQVA